MENDTFIWEIYFCVFEDGLFSKTFEVKQVTEQNDFSYWFGKYWQPYLKYCKKIRAAILIMNFFWLPEEI